MVVMLGRLAPLILVACGRLGFDERAVSDDGGPEPTNPEFRSLCGFAPVTVIQNGVPLDDATGTLLAEAVRAGCSSSVATRTVSQDEPGVLDGTTGRPLLARDELAAIGGGDGPNRAIAYLLRDDTPVTWVTQNTGFTTFRERASGRVIVQGPTSAGHDYAFVMVIREPISGGHILSAQGIVANGTIVAGDYFAREIAPTLATNTNAWSIVEWTDSDMTRGPSDGDDLVLIESGR